jgi:bifunctional ADP-heptose synthase (sugar kinase/adenylyltransferase)
MDKPRFDELLDWFPSRHLLVVGDFFLDKYLSIDPALSEISLETGLEAYQVVGIRHSPGAAGTVVSNLRALDIQVSVVGLTGRDGQGFELRQDLQQLDVNIEGLLEAPDRFTPTYTKPMLRAGQPDGPEREINRLDIKNRQPLPAPFEQAIIAQLERLAPTVDGVIIADQVQERNCGVITDAVRTALTRLAETYPTTPFAADSRVRISEFKGIIIKPNLHEARAATPGLASQPESSTNSGLQDSAKDTAVDDLMVARQCGAALFQKNRQPVFVTLGERGVLVVDETGDVHIPGIPAAGEIDIVGAGDSAMAGLAAGLSAGGTPEEAAILGNLAASITIQQLGTTGTASRQQLRRRFDELSTPSVPGK